MKGEGKGLWMVAMKNWDTRHADGREFNRETMGTDNDEIKGEGDKEDKDEKEERDWNGNVGIGHFPSQTRRQGHERGR